MYSGVTHAWIAATYAGRTRRTGRFPPKLSDSTCRLHIPISTQSVIVDSRPIEALNILIQTVHANFLDQDLRGIDWLGPTIDGLGLNGM